MAEVERLGIPDQSHGDKVASAFVNVRPPPLLPTELNHAPSPCPSGNAPCLYPNNFSSQEDIRLERISHWIVVGSDRDPTSQIHVGSELIVPLGRESVTLDPTATTGQTMQVQETRDNQINSTRDMLSSRVLLERVVEKIGGLT